MQTVISSRVTGLIGGLAFGFLSIGHAFAEENTGCTAGGCKSVCADGLQQRENPGIRECG